MTHYHRHSYNSRVRQCALTTLCKDIDELKAKGRPEDEEAYWGGRDELKDSPTINDALWPSIIQLQSSSVRSHNTLWRHRPTEDEEVHWGWKDDLKFHQQLTTRYYRQLFSYRVYQFDFTTLCEETKWDSRDEVKTKRRTETEETTKISPPIMQFQSSSVRCHNAQRLCTTLSIHTANQMFPRWLVLNPMEI